MRPTWRLFALHFETDTRTVFPYGVSPFFPFRCPPAITACSLLRLEILFLRPMTSFSSAAILESRSRSSDFVCLSVMATMVPPPESPPREESRDLRRFQLLETRPIPPEEFWNMLIVVLWCVVKETKAETVSKITVFFSYLNLYSYIQSVQEKYWLFWPDGV